MTRYLESSRKGDLTEDNDMDFGRLLSGTRNLNDPFFKRGDVPLFPATNIPVFSYVFHSLPERLNQRKGLKL